MHILAHMQTPRTLKHSNRRAPPMLCSHVERPEQLGASVSQRLDLLPRAGMEERWKSVRGREGGTELWEVHEEGLRKVIAGEVSEGGGLWRTKQSCWQEQWLGKQPRGVEKVEEGGKGV